MTKKKKIYYDVKNILTHDAQYNILLGQRSNGKSYSVKSLALTKAYKHDEMFIYLRRLQTEVKNVNVESYFADMPIDIITDNEYTTISVYSGKIFFANYDEKGKIVRGKQIGMAMYLNGAGHYKSMALPHFYRIIYEEFITNEFYLDNECDTLQDLVSTVARDRDIQVFMIGNTISRFCPYFREWELLNIPKQEQGTIDDYFIDTGSFDDDGNSIKTKISVEYCSSIDNKSKMLFGNKAKSANMGAWETKVQPKINVPYNDCKIVYSIAFLVKGFKYKAEMLKYGNDLFIFVKPLSNKSRLPKRVVTDEFCTKHGYTTELVAINKADKIFLELVRQGKICFSDNLTGSEFKMILRKGV